ncbi:MAG: MBL fold metallo-hydrolase [Candidatus Helarchaeota archaeon]
MKFPIIKVIAAESLGVRSFSTFIDTGDLKILIDPGCALGPKSKYKIPHPIEYYKLNEKTHEIIEYAKKSDIILISHYHNDHFKNFVVDYDYIFTNNDIAEQIYLNKRIFIKDPKNYINHSQKERSKIFLKNVKRICDEIIISDNNKINYGQTELIFSRPVYHGELYSTRGWVIMTKLKINNKWFLFTSDIQGPIIKDTMDLISENEYINIFLDGIRINKANDIFIQNLKELFKISQKIILDHHMLRDFNWKNWINTKISRVSEKIICAAEFNNEKILQLEASRNKLFNKFPPTEDFKAWMNLTPNIRKKIRPPFEDQIKNFKINYIK